MPFVTSEGSVIYFKSVSCSSPNLDVPHAPSTTGNQLGPREGFSELPGSLLLELLPVFAGMGTNQKMVAAASHPNHSLAST